MKIYNKIVLDKDNNIIEEDHFEYNGPISYCGNGGGSSSDSGASGSDAGWEANDTSMVDEVSLTGGNNPDRSEGDWRDNTQHTYGGPVQGRTDAHTMSGSGVGVGGDNISSDGPGPGGEGARGQATQNPGRVGRQDPMGGRVDYSAQQMRDVDPSSFTGSGDTVTARDLHISIHGTDPDGSPLDQEEIDAASQRVTAGTNQNQRQDLTFAEHWANRPAAIKWSPTLSFLYAGGKNVGEWFSKNKGTSTYDSGRHRGDYEAGDRDESQMMHDVAPHAPYIVSGTTKPTNSPAANWYQNLGNSNLTGGNTFNMATEYAAAKAKQQSILGSPSPIGQLAVNDSPFYNWLKDRNLDKGIL